MALLFASTGQVAATTIIVDNDGTECPNPDYMTIQAAVDAAGEGDIIQVCAGTYPESVVIDESLTLAGPNAGMSALATRQPEAHITSLGTTVLIQSPDVTVDGFTIHGDFGVYVQAPGAVVANNIVSGTTRALSLDFAGDGASVLDNDIVSNVRSLHVSAGNKTNVEINRNRFSGPLAATGIFFSGNFAIDGFDFSDNQVLHLANIAANISDGTVNDNTFDVALPGTLSVQISLHHSTVTENTFEGDDANACLQLFGSQFGLVPSHHVTISDNTFTDCGAASPSNYAIQLSPDVSFIDITNNTITNGVEGVNTRDATVWTVSATIHVNLNNITDNTGFGVRNGQTGGVLDAECNWWGSATGPGPVGPGTGDNVSIGVDYTPWLLDSAPGGACVGGDEPSTRDDCKDGGWMTRARADASTFENQGDCMQYVHSGK